MQSGAKAFSVLSKLNPFPLRGTHKFSIVTSSAESMFAKNVIIGTGIGLVFGGAFRFWHKKIYDARRDDYYKQLELANKEEREKRRKNPDYEPTYKIWSRDELE